MKQCNPGILYVVATPIGNMGDITLRALETFKTVDIIACEDTRVTGNMLHHLGIKKPLVSYHQHSKFTKIDYIIEELNSGKNIALVTDSGTPGISDPGQALIKAVQDTRYKKQDTRNKQNSNSKFQIDNNETMKQSNSGIEIIPVPGPSALAAAVSVSGLVDKEFYFAGFLPKKKGRQTLFKKLATLEVPVVIYESAFRIEKTLHDVLTYFGAECEVFLAREITKMFEEYWGGQIEFIINDLKNHQLKGEFVLQVKRNQEKNGEQGES